MRNILKQTYVPRSYGGTVCTLISRYFNTYSTVHSLTVYSLLVATVQNNSLNTQHFNKNYNMKVAAALSFLLSSAAFSQCLSFSISPRSHQVVFRHVPARVWGRLINHLRSRNLDVEGIGSFDIDELRNIENSTSTPVTTIFFFHSAGDLQRAIHANEVSKNT